MATKQGFLAALDSKLAQRKTKRVTPRAQVQAIPSGVTLLDNWLLGCGGWPCGFAVELMGAEGACKTSLAYKSIANAQALGFSTVLIETEHRFVAARARQLGVRLPDPDVDDPLALALIQSEDIGDLEQSTYDVINAAKEGGEPVLVFWDSLAATPTPKERARVSAKPASLVDKDGNPKLDKDGKPKTEKGGGIADRAREYSRIIRTIAGSVHRANIAFVVINQLRTDIGVKFGDNQISPGGHAMKYWAAARLQLRYPSAIKQGTEHVGKAPKCTTIKSLFENPFRSAKLHFRYSAGWDDDADLYEFGITRELLDSGVKKSAASVSHVREILDAHAWDLAGIPRSELGWEPPKTAKKSSSDKPDKPKKAAAKREKPTKKASKKAAKK